MPRMGGIEGSGIGRPDGAATLDELVDRLRQLRALAGTPSYSTIAQRVYELRAGRGVAGPGPGRVTIYDCFRTGRRRLDPDLFADVVAALAGDDAVPRWATALTRVTGRRRPHRPVVRTGVPTLRRPLRGRDAERARLRALPSGSAVLLTGMPGVGKTDLAMAVSADLAAAGARVLVVDLHGFDPAAGPAEPDTVLELVLRALDTPGEQLATLDGPSRVALLRRIVDATPTVLVLDNAADAGQVGDLLLSRTHSWTLITSRREFALPTSVHTVTLEPLSPDAGLEVVTDLLGPERVASEPVAARALVEACGGLPLQLAVVGGITADSNWSLADLAHRLRGLGTTGAVPALEGSFAELPPEARRALTYLALHPPGPIDTTGLAALLDLSIRSADLLVDRLAHDNLVRRLPSARLAVHDLVRAFARRRLLADVPRSVQLAATRRLAVRLVAGAEEAAVKDPPDDDWLTRHRALIWESLRSCGGDAPYERAAGALSGHLERHVLLDEAVRIYAAALTHAPPERAWRQHRLLGRMYLRASRPAEAEHELRICLADPHCEDEHDVRRSLGRALRLSARPSEARTVLDTVLREAAGTDDLSAGRAAFELALIESAAGHHHRAEERLARARELFTRAVANDDLALCASAGGWLALARHDDRAARRHAAEAAEHLATVTDGPTAARLLHFRSSWLRLTGRTSAAADLLAAPQAVEAVERHSTVGQSIRLLRARLAADAGRVDEAVEQLREIQRDCHRLHLTEDSLEALNDLGDLLLCRGDATEARDVFEYASALAAQSEDVIAGAIARAGIDRAAQSG